MSQLKHPTWWGAVNAVIWGGKIAQSKSPSCFKNMTKCCKWHVAQPKTISNKWLHPTRGGVGLKNKSINIKKQRLLPYKQDKSIVRTTRLLKFSDHNFKLKPCSQNPGNVDGKFKTLRIDRFCRFQRYQTRKRCGISWVIIKKLWNENSARLLTQNSNSVWNFC